MADKLLLHELLKEDQEPFHLKSYIADRKSQLKKPTLHLQKRKPISSKRTNNLSSHACFLSFQNSPEVSRSPFLDFPSPAKSPCKSPRAAVFLHIPSRTAGLLVEAAMRIQKQNKPHTKTSGFGIFGSFLKRLNRSKSKKRAIGNSDSENATRVEETVEESIRCSCSNRRLSSADWTENMDFEASTSDYASECSEEINSDFGMTETRFCASPFVFSLHRSPSSSGRRTPEFCSPAASPCRRVKQEKENYESQNLDRVRGEEEEEEKEQCSPVSILDTPFEDDRHEDAEEDDDYDLGCSYDNLQRAKEQLLYRLRRFEKLAELDPIELERKLLEKSDEEDHQEREALDDDEPLSMYERLVSDLIVEEKSEAIDHSGSPNDVVMGRVSKRFDSWKEVEFNTIDMMVGLDLKRVVDGWNKFDEQVEETAEEIELGIYALLIEELYDELL